MGTIYLENMEFFAYHGHFEEEKIVGNKFLVNLELETDLSRAGESDNLDDALNYQEAYNIVNNEMQHTSHLLEHIGKRILDALYLHFDSILNRATVKISKLNPPIGGKTNKVTISITR
jgi:dihydroneopterin aldolase